MVKTLKIYNATKLQKRAIKEIAPWVLQHLVGKRLANNIELNIRFKKLKKKEAEEGNTTWEDNNHKPREFTIELDSELDIEEMIPTLCHELVHVKQLAKGEMKDLFKGPYNICWKGQKMNTRDSSINYWELPWEIESFGREDGLYIMWKESKQLQPYDTFQTFLDSSEEEKRAKSKKNK